MKLAFSRLLHGAWLGLVATSVAVACGSSSDRRSDKPAEGGAGGIDFGGAGGEVASPQAGAGAAPTPSAGNGGEPAGQGGAPGAAGVPVLAAGAPPALAGAGGEGGAPLPPVDCTTISFDDPGLELAVRSALNKDASSPITPEEAATVTELFANGYSISALDGIECLTSLATIDLGIGGAANNVSDLRPLRYLASLKELDLSYNPLADLSALGQLPSLQTLDLSRAIDGNDLGPLAKAPSLTELRLSQTTVGDLSPLGRIPTLTSLDLSYATFLQPSTIAELTNVKQLDVRSLDDAAPLAPLTQLTHLELQDPMTNTSALASLVNLIYLSAYDIGLTSATPIGTMTKLEDLSLDSNQITDIGPLSGLTQLTRLSLTGNAFTSLAPLVANPGLGANDFVYMYASGVTCLNDKANIATLTNRGVTLYGAPNCP